MHIFLYVEARLWLLLLGLSILSYWQGFLPTWCLLLQVGWPRDLPVLSSVLDQPHTTVPGYSTWFWGLNSGPASLPYQLSHLLHTSVAGYMSIQCLLVYSVGTILAHAGAMSRLWVAFRRLQQSAPPSPGCKMLIKKKNTKISIILVTVWSSPSNKKMPVAATFLDGTEMRMNGSLEQAFQGKQQHLPRMGP